jgi:phosphocarrier protein FPr
VVGIVIVSHSGRLAEGVAELAREMGGPDVRLETAGGLALEGNPIGTDAVLVAEAIERAWSEEGVLVLMDLGSAVLSAEMALEILQEDRRRAVLLCEAPLVEGAVAAAVAAKLGLTLEAVAAEARGGLAGKATHLGSETPTTEAVLPPRRSGPARSIVLAVELPHGLHARPAARLVQVASGFDADVEVANGTTGRGPVTARSLNAVATLGVAKGHQLEVTATGPEAERAVDAIAALAGRSFDEGPEAAPADLSTPPHAGVEADGALRGIGASPGIALGPARRFRVPDLDVPDRDASDPTAERRVLDGAIDAVREDVERQRAAAADRIGGHEATIFDAHLLFLHDESLIGPARSAIEAEGRSAALAWRDAVAAVAESWEALSDEYLRARVEDLRSVGRQVLARILGVPLPVPTLDGPGILVVADLAPAEATALDSASVKGIASAFGAPTSHASIIARALGIPAVVGTGPDLLAIADGQMVAMDASAGLVYVDPPIDVTTALESARAAFEADRRTARAAASRPASTIDGEVIEVAANVGSVREVAAAVEEGADGVGLFRTELLFLETGPASEEIQTDVYRRAAKALSGRPLTIRTLDAGADKPVPGLQQPAERNPFLGMRGIRLGLDRPELLETQLRAILRVARDHPLRVMFPMIATLDELIAAREVLDRARRAVGGEPSLEVGIMVEVPSAALTAEVLAPLVDFFSIGTNDLTQYTLAADRGDPRLASLADPLHPAVLRLIRHTVEGARASGTWVGVCGELAGDSDATALLIGIGVRELSMSAPAIPLVKRAVRATESGEAREHAAEAMALPSANAVRALLARRI